MINGTHLCSKIFKKRMIQETGTHEKGENHSYPASDPIRTSSRGNRTCTRQLTGTRDPFAGNSRLEISPDAQGFPSFHGRASPWNSLGPSPLLLSGLDGSVSWISPLGDNQQVTAVEK